MLNEMAFIDKIDLASYVGCDPVGLSTEVGACMMDLRAEVEACRMDLRAEIGACLMELRAELPADGVRLNVCTLLGTLPVAPYVRVEPDYLWLTNANLFTDNVDVYSNVTWNVI